MLQMRKRTIRNGMRLVLSALIIILVVSFYHGGLSDVFSLSYDAEMRFYRLGIFWAAAIGGYGVVQSAFGLILPSRQSDSGIRIMPMLFLIVGVVSLFFYLLAASFDAPHEPTRDRLRPGETITI
jgi:nitrate/nitrite transporter NarK